MSEKPIVKVDNSQPIPVSSKRIPITFAVDILFTLVLFNSFVQWHSIIGSVPKALGILMILIVINDWFSVRASTDFYTLPILIIDILVVFIFVSLFELLKLQSTYLDYTPVFWVYLSVLSLLYTLWDIVLSFSVEKPSPRKMRVFAAANLVCGAIMFATYIFLARVDLSVRLAFLPNVAISSVIIFPAVIIWVVLLIVWTIIKFVD